MTKNRAQKHAARERAAITGEPYVVARRHSTEPPPRDLGRLHDLTHRVPGVSAHVDGGLQANAVRNPAVVLTHQGRPNSNQPRLLVGWQNRIAKLFGQ